MRTKIRKMISHRYLIPLVLFFQLGQAQEAPMVEISNGTIRAEIYLPDSEKGYYQGTRFDWSAVMPVLEHKGHSYFGKWFKEYDSKSHESVMGPVEEFAPIGYEEAEVGETFVKIGVGALIKPKEPKYAKFKTYEIASSGVWHIQRSSNQVVFSQKLEHGDYSYEYIKKVVLPHGKSEMVIEHSLKNTGHRTLETEVYDHNFFFIDSLDIGPGYVVRFPFEIIEKGTIKGIGEFAEIKEDEIVFTKELGKDDQVYMGNILGYDENEKGYEISVENRTSGAGVKITCNRPLSRLVFWSAQKAICPEPYIDIVIAPKEAATWTIKYEFYDL